MLTTAARAQCTHAFPNGTTGLQCQSFGSTPPCAGGDGKFFATPFTLALALTLTLTLTLSLTLTLTPGKFFATPFTGLHRRRSGVVCSVTLQQARTRRQVQLC